MAAAAAAIVENRYGTVHAPRGWQYAARFESAYLAGDLEPRVVRRAPAPSDLHDRAERSHAQPLRDRDDHAELSRAAGAHLSRLGELREPRLLHAALEELVHVDAAACVQADALDPAQLFANDHRLNVVIAGAGPVGLAVASALLLAPGARTNVVVIDNRSPAPGRKHRYARRWLTAIDRARLDGIVENELHEIFARVGTRQIGVTIRVLETLLLLSCRRMGARFCFDAAADLRFLAERPVDLVIDATGDRLRPALDPGAPFEIVDRLDTGALHNLELLASYGVNVGASSPEACIEVGAAGDVRFPIFQGQRITQAMVKITGIPARICAAIVDHVRTRNEDNKLYVWRGSMRDEINEGLIIVNLTGGEYEALCDAGVFPMSFVEARVSLPAGLDPRIADLLDQIDTRSTDQERANIEIDAPFVWRPYLLDERGPATLHGRPLVRVGDSIYNGNVKIANGMSPHLRHVAHVQKVLWDHATSAHADTIARSMGRTRR